MFQSFKGTPHFFITLLMAFFIANPSVFADDFGEPVNGLSLSLTTDKAKIKKDESVQLRMKFRNNDDQEDLMLCFYILGDKSLSVELTEPDGNTKTIKFYPVRKSTRRPMESDYPVLKASEEFPLFTKVNSIYYAQPSFPGTYWNYEFPVKGQYKIKVSYTIDDTATNPINKKRCWSGKVYSNPVLVEVSD